MVSKGIPMDSWSHCVESYFVCILLYFKRFLIISSNFMAFFFNLHDTKKWSFSLRMFSLSFSLSFLQIWSHFWSHIFVRCWTNLGLFSRTSDVTKRSKSYEWSLKLSKRSFIQSLDYRKYFDSFFIASNPNLGKFRVIYKR